MPEVSTETRNGHLRTTVHLRPGERILLCRCFKSAEFPICDSTHKTLDGEAGPVVVDCPFTEPPHTPKTA